MSTFAERLRKVRGNNTRAMFAENIGISPRALVNYESGTNLPSIDVAARICAQLGISADWLLLGEGNMYSIKTSNTAQSPAATLVDNAAQAAGVTLNEKQRAAVIDIIEEELKNRTSRIIKAVAGG